MKTILLTLISIISASVVNACENDNLLLQISVLSQNTQFHIARYSSGGAAPSYPVFKESLDQIEGLLTKLSESEKFQSKQYTVKSNDLMTILENPAFDKIIIELAEEYGIYVAKELCGVGSNIQFIALANEEPVTISACLPINVVEEMDTLFTK